MRLTYVIPYFAPAWAYGGPPRLAYDMARKMAERGHAVSVVTTDALDAEQRARPLFVTVNGIRVQRVPNVSNALAWKYKIFLPATFGKTLSSSLRGAELAHLFDFRSYLNAVALNQLERRGIPYVLSAVGELPLASGPKRPLKVVFDRLYGRRLVRGAAALLAQTEDEARWYRRMGGCSDQIRVVPLAIDTAHVSPAKPGSAFRAKLGIPTSGVVFLFLGRLHEYKGLDMLVRAFAQVRARRSDVHLVVAGRDDGYLATAKQLARKLTPRGSVVFPGAVYGQDRFDLYRDADVFVITPSHAEQTSLAALEACAVGIPVITTEQAPIDGLEPAGAGLTVPYELASIRRALDDIAKADRASMGRRAAALVRDRFSWTVVERALDDVYAQAARSRRSPAPARPR
jgi:glycosyltransferase involved in cell wall biosynthesis